MHIESSTEIPGLLLVHLDVHHDSRGWFKENWQREKLAQAGLDSFTPVQNNISYNTTSGTIRGIHAEPWDKLVSVASGSVFGAWVDLRRGNTFGHVVTAILDESLAVFVPKGVGNGFQTLTDSASYSYLVNQHWSSDAIPSYRFVRLDDPELSIGWPLPIDSATISSADQSHPLLKDVTPFKQRALVIGASGQVGRALQDAEFDADFMSSDTLDLSDEASFERIKWSDYDVVINAAAYTKVDAAETPDGASEAWNVNVLGVQRLVKHIQHVNATLVHISSDYVYDGSHDAYTEDDTFSPLGTYGRTKAMGDIFASTLPKHYILRTSWVIGNGSNFVNTMTNLAGRSETEVFVVNDQIGRPTFANDIAAGITHLLNSKAPYGTYNLTSAGEPVSWYSIALAVFDHIGANALRLKPVSTPQYAETQNNVYAARPASSILDLSKIQSFGFYPPNWREALSAYLSDKDQND